MLEPGSTLGDFEVLESLGQGAMGQVYRARGPSGEVVAVKVIARDLASDPSACQRFASESSILKDLNQPRIVAARTGLEREGDQLFYAMEWVDGVDLAALLEREGRLPSERALSAVADVLEALTYAHARDVLHRDIKASNVLVEGSGRMKLSDFGLARAMDGTRVTRAGSVLGTPAYMAPELAEGGDASIATEVYAVGVLLHELLSGAPPFRGESALAVLHQHINAAPPPLEGVSAKVQGIVARALAKRPLERYTSATDMRDAVLLARGGLESAEPAQAPAPERGIAEAETREFSGASLPPASPRPLNLAEGPDPSGAAAFATTLVPASPQPEAPEGAGRTSPSPAQLGLGLLVVAGLVLLAGGLSARNARLDPQGDSRPTQSREGQTPAPAASTSSPLTTPARSPAASLPASSTPSPLAVPAHTPSPGASPRAGSSPSPLEAPSASPPASDPTPRPPASRPRIEVSLKDGATFRAELVRIDLEADQLVTLVAGAERRDSLADVASYERLP